MSTKRIIGIATGAVLAAGMLTGGAFGAAWLFTPPTHATISVSQSHEISTSAQEDTQLAAATSRTSSEWKIQQDAAARKAAAEAAAAALAAQQAAEAQAAADAAAQAQAQQDAQTSTDTTDSNEPDAPSGGATKCPVGSQANSGTTINGIAVDTSCFPEICFHITLPDPAHPECVTAFKP